LFPHCGNRGEKTNEWRSEPDPFQWTPYRRENHNPCTGLCSMKRSKNMCLSQKVLVTAMAAALIPGAYAQDDGLEEIQVTGSRIRNTTSMTTPTPVTAITTDELVNFNPASTM